MNLQRLSQRIARDQKQNKRTKTMTTTTDTKPLSITIFGATGFTGQLITKLILEDEEVSQRNLKFGLAGRSEKKVQALLPTDAKNSRLASVIVASVDDEKSIDEMTSQSKVLLNCVGPFSKYGEAVVRSCIRNNCHYADITGEPAYIKTLVEKYHEEAQQKGVKIVNCVGFDSIPADIGVYHLLKQLPIQNESSWDQNSYVAVNGYVKLVMPGLISYGTYHTVVTSLNNVSIFGSKNKKKRETQSEKPKKKAVLNRSIRWEPSVNSYVIPFSTSDPTVVNRSAVLQKYVLDGKVDFQYAHFLQVEKWYNVLLFILVALSLFLITRFSWGASFLLKIWRQPGEGPSEENRKKSSCLMTFQGIAKLKQGIQTVTTNCTVAGDPGYDETAKMALQSTLCLLDTVDGEVKQNSMSTVDNGVMSTAAVFGDNIIKRLHEHSNVRFATKRSTFTKNEESDFEKVKREASKYVYLPSST